ncbi:MAG: alpha/beta fold hydrolase [Pseudomonadota bacterium]
MKTTKVFKSEEEKREVLKYYDKLLARWPVPKEEQLIETQYGTTYGITCGDRLSPPLILLHGTNSNSTMWLGDIAEYSRHFRVYALDIPGEPGKSGDTQYPLDSPAYADWLEEVLKALELKKVSLMGLSLGGWLAVNYALRHQERIERLVLLCPSGIGRTKASFLFRAFPLMLMGDKGIDCVTRIVYGSRVVPVEVLEYSRILSKAFNLRKEPIPIFKDKELECLTMPVMVLAGSKDALLCSDETISRMKQALPQADARLLPDMGHALLNMTDIVLPFLLK